jgi:cell division protein FtsL
VAILSRTLARAQPLVKLQLSPVSVAIMAGVAVVVISMVRMMLVSGLATTSFDIQSLEQERLERLAHVRNLEREVASLQSLDRIERDAARLGLTAPQERTTVQVGVAPPPAYIQPTAAEEKDSTEQGSPWWRDLLDLLPF